MSYFSHRHGKDGNDSIVGIHKPGNVRWRELDDVPELWVCRCTVEELRFCMGSLGRDDEDCDGEVLVCDKLFCELEDGDEMAHAWAAEKRCMLL